MNGVTTESGEGSNQAGGELPQGGHGARRSGVVGFALVIAWLLVVGLANLARGEEARTGQATIPSIKPVLVNADFECSVGYYETVNDLGEPAYVPNGWTLTATMGGPTIDSARIFFAPGDEREGACSNHGRHVERIGLEDSFLVRARDLERPPDPGKQFDVSIFQKVEVTVGGAYSVRGWFLSLCGGSAVPSDCPGDVYIAKMLGIDPTGGTDPNAATVVWAENRENFVEGDRWKNLRVAAIAQAPQITIFARLRSSANHHGNHGFIDVISAVRAPIVNLDTLPAVITHTRQLTLTWVGQQSPDVADAPGGPYDLLIDVQSRKSGEEAWSDFVVDANHAVQRSAVFTAECANATYEFRIRARAFGTGRNQQYVGVWSEPVQVRFDFTRPARPSVPVEGEPRLYLPMVGLSGC